MTCSNCSCNSSQAKLSAMFPSCHRETPLPGCNLCHQKLPRPPSGQGNCCNSCYCGGNQQQRQQEMVQSRCGEPWTRATRWQIVEPGSFFILCKELLEFLRQFVQKFEQARCPLKKNIEFSFCCVSH